MNHPAPVTSTITADIDAATLALLERVAKKRGMTPATFAAQAIRRVAKHEADFDAFIQEGIDDLDAARTVPNEVVMVELDAMVAKHEARCRD
ncbi:CopG family ribbon-helix-helix protein [Sphingomonas sp. PB4P5]|uniref:CopG family ribbon-helix-helix protein n=1 Tax=Parasphingomonas puruogangriensis TaxID=3096155 RepID=UPI002FCA970E